ncbi:MAG: LuxR C-terminal-related transcriptional regulator [Treponema sp.]|nr:LuxR C-terminal-related transcriptional regulator [Treponema sp.]
MEALRKTKITHGPARDRAQRDSAGSFHFERQRINGLLSRATKSQVVEICAGAGYGKTSAALDFARRRADEVIWIEFSEADRRRENLWQTCLRAAEKIDQGFARAIAELGFPDSADKLSRYAALTRSVVPLRRRIIIADNFHLPDDPAALRFLERAIRHMLVGTRTALISRSASRLGIADLIGSGRVFSIGEDDLRFTEDEISRYFDKLGTPLAPEDLREIARDTGGWPFALNLAARAYRNAPGYRGYVGSALRSGIFRLMEANAWSGFSAGLQGLLAKIAMTGVFSEDFVALLAGNEKSALAELDAQNAYIRRDGGSGAFVAQPMYLEFLREKSLSLAEAERNETYAAAADWCERHGFAIEALFHREKIGDYSGVAEILREAPTQMPAALAERACEILSRAPERAFLETEALSALSVRALACLGRWKEAEAEAQAREAGLLALADGAEKWRALAGLYHAWGFLRALLGTADGKCDFDRRLAQAGECLERSGDDGAPLVPYPLGAWINRAGCSRRGALAEYEGALKRAREIMAKSGGAGDLGAEFELALSERKYFEGNFKEAQFLAERARGLARSNDQGETELAALFCALRVALARGNYANARAAAAAIEEVAGRAPDRAAIRDVSLGWYHCMLGLDEKIPLWLRDGFSSYAHAGFAENMANQTRARLRYQAGDYPELLSYIADMRERESYLFGRVELLAMEACALYRMREKAAALDSLEEAYKAAAPNEIVMAFAELGKDMRTLTSAALKEPRCRLPAQWLEATNRRSACYAKRLAHVASIYRDDNLIVCDAVLSTRETDVLGDLAQGLSRAEIAAARDLSINTVKMVIGHIHAKMGTENLADLIRVAVQRKMIRTGG